MYEVSCVEWNAFPKKSVRQKVLVGFDRADVLQGLMCVCV